MIKYGATRTVLIVGRYALKFPSFYSWGSFLSGLLANMQEKVFSRMRSVKLCPVIFWLPGGFLVIMPRADPMPSWLFESFDFVKWINENSWIIPVENKLDSFGILDGNIVAVDYGS